MIHNVPLTVAVTYAIALAILWGYAAVLWLQFPGKHRHGHNNPGGRS